MKLQEIYDRDIFRHINPAVVVSEKDEATIEAEIKEYVFTNELIEKIYLILNTVLNKKSGKTGIWINGYYGSGKSHFIKYVHYLLDAKTSPLAFEAFSKAVGGYDTMAIGANEDITLSNIKLLQKRVNSSHTDNIMFNVEDETDDGSKERLTRIFLNMFNKFRGYNANDIPLALLLEKPLDQKGVFQAFKDKIDSELGFDWNTDAAQVSAFQLEGVLDIAKSVYPELDTVSLHGKLSNPDSFKVGINATLIPELQNFIKNKEPNYRLFFLIDEVSQYIGSNKEILLNFQNIIERISNDCNNQVWVACTAQQTLDEVSISADGVTDVQDEFGKILGRFDTRISLQSNDASYITQRRVLDKSSEGIEALNKLYATNKDYIENQFKISHELYKGYQNEEEFIVSYPFIPYQFKLIAHVFEAFQQLQFVIKEVKDNERSVLGITHFTAKQHANEEVGMFIPFDGFYNQQFHTNLTNRGSKAIQNGLELTYVKNNAFAQRVVKVLFMISNLLENQRQTFPSTIENIAVLLMDQLDQNKMQLHTEIKEVLDKLVDESIIREEKGSYFFFNEDEIDVQNLIKNQTVGLDDKWSTFDSLFRPLVKISPKVSFGKNDFKMAYSIENKEFFRQGEFNLIVLLTDSTHLPQKALDVNKKDLLICINEWYNKDESLRRDFDWYCKTNKYFTNNSGGETGERSKTNDNFRIRNNQLKTKIEQSLKNKFSDTRFISQNTILETNQVNGATASERVKNLIEKHLSGIYKNHKLSEKYADNQMMLKKSAADTQTMFPELSPAEQMVNDFITANGHQVTVHDLIKNFEKEPFGWRFEAVLDVLIHLVKKKKREFAYKKQQRYPIVDFINKAVITSERFSCEVVTGEDIDPILLNNVAKAYKAIFNENLKTSTDGNEQFDKLIIALKEKQQHYQKSEGEYYGYYPFGVVFQQASNQLREWSQMRDPKKLFNAIVGAQDGCKELFDKAKGIQDFAHRSLKEYESIRKFVTENRENIKELDASAQEKADKLMAFTKLDDPRKEFRHARKAFDEIKSALKEFTETLKKEVLHIYSEIFAELKTQADSFKVSENDFAQKDYTLSSIKNMTSIAALSNKKLDADNFKTAQLRQIVDVYETEKAQEKAKKQQKNSDGTPKKTYAVPKPKSTTYHLANGTSIIRTNEELDTYISKIKSEMSELLKAKKTIILK
ncbi:BREX system P-loop protein BrxC [Marinifilum sp. RC60d5]|uniref:BREX system P-loop protein BrxC n=1 Tax=Marinifilum sp. RC60d5 TaxID=3458414 RepID=UPI004035A996